MPRKTFTDENGNRHDISAKTEEDLAIKIYLRKREIAEGKYGMVRNITVEKWAEVFLEEYKRPVLKGRGSFKDYKNRLYHSVVEPIGSKRTMTSIRPIDCQKVVNEVSCFSQSHIDKVYQAMCQMFKVAKSNRIIEYNPTEDIIKPKGYKNSRRSITEEERKYTFLAAENHRGGLWVLTIMYCGLRPEETTLIQGKHIHGDIMYVPGTKTPNAKRSVPIPPPLIDRLPKLKDEEYLFKNVYGDRLTDSGRAKLWKSFKRQMNIEMGCEVYRNQVLPLNFSEVLKGADPIFPVADDLVPYCYRHTYGTDLQIAGMPIDLIKELMGHTEIEMTMNYVHFSEASLKKAQQIILDFHNMDKTPTPTPTLRRTKTLRNARKNNKFRKIR